MISFDNDFSNDCRIECFLIIITTIFIVYMYFIAAHLYNKRFTDRHTRFFDGLAKVTKSCSCSNLSNMCSSQSNRHVFAHNKRLCFHLPFRIIMRGKIPIDRNCIDKSRINITSRTFSHKESYDTGCRRTIGYPFNHSFFGQFQFHRILLWLQYHKSLSSLYFPIVF